MTAAHTLLDQTPDRISPTMAAALFNFIDVVDVPMDSDEADRVFRRSRDLMERLTADQATRLRSIIHTLRDVNLRQ
jgi:hypothetical protein